MFRCIRFKISLESELKARSFWALARLKGKTWLNAEHLGGCAFRAKKFKAKHGKGLGFRCSKLRANLGLLR
ncbi:hypothetical protein QTC65_000966 [Campylobacter upsaliensis]|nr:hypothetical protein [Campylobacter upsaliensis]